MGEIYIQFSSNLKLSPIICKLRANMPNSVYAPEINSHYKIYFGPKLLQLCNERLQILFLRREEFSVKEKLPTVSISLGLVSTWAKKRIWLGVQCLTTAVELSTDFSKPQFEIIKRDKAGYC